MLPPRREERRTDKKKRSMSSIRTVFTVGLALNAPVVPLMCLFDDAAVLSDDDAAVPPELETLDEEAAPTGGAPPGPTGCWGALGRQHIPYILFCSDFFVYVGAGMTVKFFPLYFKNAVGLSPAAVQVSTCCRRAGRSGGLTKEKVLYMLLPLLMAAVSTAAQRFSVAVGRVQCVLCAQFLGIGCLVTMVVLSFVVRCEDWRVMAPLFLVRSTLMSSVIPILDSILMDNVPRETRARWKSLDSIHAVGWCGSAWLGGWVADTFRFNGHDGECMQPLRREERRRTDKKTWKAISSRSRSPPPCKRPARVCSSCCSRWWRRSRSRSPSPNRSRRASGHLSWAGRGATAMREVKE